MTLSLLTRLSDLATAVATDIKQLRIWTTGSSSGNLAGLTTTDKTSLVAALNEVNAKPSAAGAPNADTSQRGIIEIATLAEVGVGIDSVRAVTPEGVRQERVALKAEILGAGVPAALDTLGELDAALNNDPNFAATMTTALGNRLRVDINNQGLSTAQQGNGQTNLGVLAASAIGDPETDLVAAYTAAKT